MSWERLASQTTASVNLSGFILDRSLRSYLGGMGLDLLASALLVWATVGIKSRRLRWGVAAASFGCLQLFGGWQREPKRLAFSLTLILCLLNLGAHARSLGASERRHRILQRSASWTHYWSSQVGNLSRQVALEALSVLSLVALLVMEAMAIRDR